MKTYEPIPIRPLRLRGVFGITWRLFRRRGFAAIGVCFVYLLVLFLLTGVAVRPLVADNFINMANEAALEGEEMLLAMQRVFNNFLLSLLISLATSLILVPMLYGTLYNEYTAKLYGQYASFLELIKRSRFNLKRFFTTQLCYSISCGALFFGVTIVIAIASGLLVPFIVFPIMRTSWEPNPSYYAGVIIVTVIFVLLILAACVVIMALLALTYPVAVNENARNFEAVKRSIKLVWQRKGRIFGTYAIIVVVLLVCSIVQWSGIIAGRFFTDTGNTSAPLIMYIFTMLVSFLFFGFFYPYLAALNTVLYFDAKVRADPSAGPQPLPEPDPESELGPYEPYRAPNADAEESDQQNPPVFYMPEPPVHSPPAAKEDGDAWNL